MYRLVFIVCLIPSFLLAQTAQTYRIILRDKGPEPFIPGSSIYQATLSLLSERALIRRTKVLPSDSLIIWNDAPLYEPYIEDIERAGAKVVLRLRWRNYAVVVCDSITAASLRTKPYILSVEPTSTLLRPQHSTRWWQASTNPYESGGSLLQLQMLHAPELHQLGISGDGVILGLIDTGFRWRYHEALRTARVIREFDFMQLDSVTSDEEGDRAGQDGHGTAVMSTLVGFYPDSLIGIAPCVQLLLAKTEDISSEAHIEEDAYSAAVEWMEAQGADIISSSLGYILFDSTESQYTTADFNGRTTIVAIAVSEAARRGVLSITAAGNTGDAPQTINSPGDADSAITVGAVSDLSFAIPRFTSRGPTVDGRLKPNLAALGVNVRIATNAGNTSFSWSSGTSMATPLIAGSAALLMSAHHDLMPWEVREFLQRNASHASEPNTAIGYGVPNVLAAALEYGIICSNPIVIPHNDGIIFGVLTRSTQPIEKVQLFLSGHSGEKQLMLQRTQWFWYTSVPIPLDDDSIRFYFLLNDNQHLRRHPTEGNFSVHKSDTLLPCGWAPAQIMLLTLPYTKFESPLSALAVPKEHPIVPIHPYVYRNHAGLLGARYTLYDLTLRKLASGVIEVDNQYLALPSLPSGTYVIHFDGAEGIIVSQLVMVY